MSFRRIPFQFTATDPSECQRAVQRRFGLPVTDKMYVDFPNSVGMGSGMKESNSASSSPRLQHRVPIFVEGSDQPIKSSVDAQNNNAHSGRKPHVRVIPIEIEDANKFARQRTYSGPAGTGMEEPTNDRLQQFKERASINRSMHDMPQNVKSSSGPRICNIPIQVEGRGSDRKSSANVLSKFPKSEIPIKRDVSKTNGCNVSKSNSVEQTEEKPPEPDINIPLKKVENILSELKSYQTGVEKFSGTAKDKQYRYLDEMLTRCMLNLDDIDTMGSERVRSARKAAVREVQASIDLLESKINASSSSGQGQESEGVSAQSDMLIDEQNKVEDQSIVTADNEQDITMEHSNSVQDDVLEIEMAENELSTDIENKMEVLTTNVPEVEMTEDVQPSKAVDKLDAEMDECSDIQLENPKMIEPSNMVSGEEHTSAGTETQECYNVLESDNPKPIQNQGDVEMDMNETKNGVSSSGTLEKSETSIADSEVIQHSSEDLAKCCATPVVNLPNVVSKDLSVCLSKKDNEEFPVSSSETVSEPSYSQCLIDKDQKVPNNHVDNRGINALI